MYNIASLTEIEKQCILRFLHRIAKTDYEVVDAELDTIKGIAKLVGIELNYSEFWWSDPWTGDDEKELLDLLERKAHVAGLLTGWAIDVMNADHVKHHNEQVALIHLMQAAVGNAQYPKAILIPLDGLDNVMIQMLEKTPEICIRKGDWWQKKKREGKPLKKVGASISWVTNGEKKFVTAANYELSTPGGSRCAEQNAIGMAIAFEPELKYENIRDVVVYGSGGLSNPCWPCGVCMENLRKLNTAKQINVYAYPSGYIYEQGKLPDTMFKLSLSELGQRQSDK